MVPSFQEVGRKDYKFLHPIIREYTAGTRKFQRSSVEV